MPIRLDKIPTPALRPERPRVWLWLSLLVLFLLLGVGGAVLFSDEPTLQRPVEFGAWPLVFPSWAGACWVSGAFCFTSANILLPMVGMRPAKRT